MVAEPFRGGSSRRSGNRCSVRYALTIIAVALVAVMSAALVTPMLIDWSSHRAAIEARLREITGANVALTGPVEVRLLPTPYLALGAEICGPPALDREFKTIDFLTLMDLNSLAPAIRSRLF